ncbi:MAG: sulfotransferase [Proteobacteria bacterium]|nr:sulfotransferase [Pseudomonadota bacterium]
MPAPTTPLEGEVMALRALQAQGDHAGAVAGAMQRLATHPANRDLLLIAAHSLRMTQRTDEALALLEQLAQHHPGFSQMFLERGLCHVARRDAPAAIADLQMAVSINPALPMGWRMLEGLLRMTGDAEGAGVAAWHNAHLASLPPPVVHAKILYGDGETDNAEALIRHFLLDFGDHPEAMRLLAQIGFARQVFDDAEMLYAGVLAMVPDHREARSEYVQTLIARHKFADAQEALAPLLAVEPDEYAHRVHAAAIAAGLGDTDTAASIYQALLDETPADDPAMRARGADLSMWLGHALRASGHAAQATEAYRAATELRADFGEAWWSLANMKVYRFADSEIATMRAGLDNPATHNEDRAHIAFALGKALEDRKEHDESWQAYKAGNDARQVASGYRPEIFETNTREQKRTCTRAFFAAREGWGVDDPAPIFVLGLPRSGSTLIEQILASHSMVEGTQELPDIQHIVHELQGREHNFERPIYPANLADCSAEQIAAFGTQYLHGTQPYRAMGRQFFIDKMPNNFRHIGLIHLILPKATIIDARRNPMDCCFSNLKQLFAKGQEFTYGIENIARYYRTYLELMRHWDTALPGRVLRVINEDLIDDPEGQIRRLLGHCALPFEESCLNFHETNRSVRTPSSEQVRRPVNRDGVGQWKPYAEWLGPLQDALGDALTTWRD